VALKKQNLAVKKSEPNGCCHARHTGANHHDFELASVERLGRGRNAGPPLGQKAQTACWGNFGSKYSAQLSRDSNFM
jgi:hypothetical protein